jgi:hypothetical protein
VANRIETRLGLTPVIKRIAHYYLCLGYGEYFPKHPHYDRIVVRNLYDFGENPNIPGEHAGGAVVEFFLQGTRTKWVEFRCQVVGGGGIEAIRRVK